MELGFREDDKVVDVGHAGVGDLPRKAIELDHQARCFPVGVGACAAQWIQQLIHALGHGPQMQVHSSTQQHTLVVKQADVSPCNGATLLQRTGSKRF